MNVKVLIDTSAWIEFLRPTGDPVLKKQVADVVVSGRAAFTCPVRFELYAGARKSEIRILEEALSFAQRIEVTVKHWDRAAEYAAELRSKGITVPASDLLIATVAVEAGLDLVTRDSHFLMIKEGVLGELRLK